MMMTRRFHFVVLSVVALLSSGTAIRAAPRHTSLLQRFVPISWRKKEYTPLLFFKVPHGMLEECDAMERTVSEIERELGVRVERLDVLRHPENQAVLELLTQQRTPPFLYHRESCQTVYLTPAATTKGGGGGDSSSKKKKQQQPPVFVNKDRVRAWAKGRFLTQHSAAAVMDDAATKVKAPVMLPPPEDDDGAMDQMELLEEMALTPEQREGKRLIQERTQAIRAKQK